MYTEFRLVTVPDISLTIHSYYTFITKIMSPSFLLCQLKIVSFFFLILNLHYSKSWKQLVCWSVLFSLLGFLNFFTETASSFCWPAAHILFTIFLKAFLILLTFIWNISLFKISVGLISTSRVFLIASILIPQS